MTSYPLIDPTILIFCFAVSPFVIFMVIYSIYCADEGNLLG